MMRAQGRPRVTPWEALKCLSATKMAKRLTSASVSPWMQATWETVSPWERKPSAAHSRRPPTRPEAGVTAPSGRGIWTAHPHARRRKTLESCIFWDTQSSDQWPCPLPAQSTEKSFGNDVEDTWVGFGGSSEEGQDVEEGVKTSLGLPAPSHTCIDNGLSYRGGAREGLWAAAGAESGGAKEQRQFSFMKSSTCCLLCVRRCVLHRYLTLLIPVKINVHYFIFRVMEMFEEIEANAFLKSMKNINLYVQEFK